MYKLSINKKASLCKVSLRESRVGPTCILWPVEKFSVVCCCRCPRLMKFSTSPQNHSVKFNKTWNRESLSK